MKHLSAAAAAWALLCLQSAEASPADQVFSPIVVEGERELELDAGTLQYKDGSRDSEWVLSAGWGVTSHWFTEAAVKWNHEGDSGARFDAFEWENRFQLTETGRYWLDAGVLLEVERPVDRSEGWEFRYGPLLQKDLDHIQLNFNVLLETVVAAAETVPTQLQYQAQVKYRWRRELEFGAQAFGELGPWNHWNPTAEQSHRVGPAVFGKLRAGERQTLSYNTALLWGLTHASPRFGARVQVEYEF